MDNELFSGIHKSGNSDVDINIQIETASIAYMYACSLYATGQIDEDQFNRMIEKYHHLIKRQHHHHGPSSFRPENDRTTVKLLGPVRRLSR